MTGTRTNTHALAAELGFALCGICEAKPSDHAHAVRNWLAAGQHGEMKWLADHLDKRLDPTRLLEGAKSIICVADLLPSSLKPQASTFPAGRIARYAHVSDYHKVMKKRLFQLADALRERHPDDQFKVCVDTAPLLEREHAQRAGLGWTGKHTLTLNEKLGSHLLLGEVVTTLALPPDPPAVDHCGTCTRCIDACPTDAITPRSVDATRCISYLTIEHRGEIDPQFFQPIGDWLYGCDICQDVCPYVAKATPPPPEPPPESPPQQPQPPERLPPGYDRHRASLPLLDVLGWDEQARRDAFVKSAMKRAKLDMIKRNALIVAGNHLRQYPDAALRARVQRVASDSTEPALVRRTAQAVLADLGQ